MDGTKSVGRKISREGGEGGATEKTRPKNSTIKPSSTLSVPCIKQGARPPPSASDAHGRPLKFSLCWANIIKETTNYCRNAIAIHEILFILCTVYNMIKLLLTFKQCTLLYERLCIDGLLIKDVRNQGSGVCPVRTFCGQARGFFKCRRPHFLVQITSDFSKSIVFPYGQRGFSGVVRVHCALGQEVFLRPRQQILLSFK